MGAEKWILGAPRGLHTAYLVCAAGFFLRLTQVPDVRNSRETYRSPSTRTVAEDNTYEVAHE